MRRFLIIGAVVVVAVAISVALWAGQRLADVPSLDVHTVPFPESDAGLVLADPSRLRITFLGATTLLFDDGETAFLTDGFFSRPSFSEVVLSPLEPDIEEIARVLERLGVERLEAVIPLHAHYDHAMDASSVAELTEARVIGSESVTNVARGHPLPERQIQLIEDGETIALGRFRLTFIESLHAPGDRAPGVITEPLKSPSHATRFRTGTVYSMLVEHEGRRVLVHSSAGFLPGNLADHQADVVYLSIGDLGTQGASYREAYWDEVVAAVGARRVVLTHWDNLFLRLDDRLQPAPRLYQDHKPAMESLYALKLRDGVELRLRGCSSRPIRSSACPTNRRRMRTKTTSNRSASRCRTCATANSGWATTPWPIHRLTSR
ncbi:MBL fold metallo-hydrolase [Alkalisalibacterium limincola]|nr:MBL fold metallo-hydrolase [Alkalisalibacterium limincola]